ncbi:hypothetical protein F4819DRAFT_346145 [Hypoxylon fuscum]|nr:hypothetical protein F4819DRAFT_346145 [Hypoxylon fuscum]
MASSATDITMPDTFPQFDNLPKELQLMIWGFSIPGRRGLEVKREPMKKLGPPAMWYACKDSRKIYREQRASIVTKVENNHEQSQRSRLYGEFDPGWFDPERDVLIWSDPVNAVAPFQLYRGYLPSLKSVTLMDLRYKQVNHDGTPTDIEYCTPLWTSIDDFRLGDTRRSRNPMPWRLAADLVQ